jgi:membrane-associated phospholipid phosphatase
MNLNLDETISTLCIELSQRVPFITKIMNTFSGNNLLKGGILISLLWYFWFNSKNEEIKAREKVLKTFIAAITALFLGRVLALILPFRARPILNPNFYFPEGSDNSWVDNWSSFPSDHAILFFSLSTGIFLISKKVGIFSYLYVSFLICFSRVYLGLHYASDILAGAFIGIFITLIVSKSTIIRSVIQNILDISVKYQGVFYALFFLFSFQISTLFIESRGIFASLFNLFK